MGIGVWGLGRTDRQECQPHGRRQSCRSGLSHRERSVVWRESHGCRTEQQEHVQDPEGCHRPGALRRRGFMCGHCQRGGDSQDCQSLLGRRHLVCRVALQLQLHPRLPG